MHRETFNQAARLGAPLPSGPRVSDKHLLLLGNEAAHGLSVALMNHPAAPCDGGSASEPGSGTSSPYGRDS